MRKQLTIALGVLALALGVAACGDDSDETTSDAAGADSQTYSGDFEAVPDAPEGADSIEGTAELTVGGDGTVAKIELSGLDPDTEYTSHVHAGGCEQPDPGGPHFMFDLNGEAMPPNEIHLPFTSDADGNGSAEATNPEQVPDPDTRSIVVHAADDSSSSEMEGMDDGDEMDSGHDDGSGHDDEMDSEHDEMDSDEEMEHSADDGHTGHTHAPKLVCADLS